MEKKQFTFTGLGWMTPEQEKQICEALSQLEQYEIGYDFRRGTKGTRLIIEGFDGTMQNPHDDSTITFIKCQQRPASEDELETEYEDFLLLFTISDDNDKGLKLNFNTVYYSGEIYGGHIY